MTNTLNDHVNEWEAISAMADSLPVFFSDGTPAPSLSVSCSGCGRVIPFQHQRGAIRSLLPDHFEMEGLAACEQCHGLTRFHYRISLSDHHVYIHWRKGSTWRSEVYEPRPIYVLLQRFIRWLLGRN